MPVFTASRTVSVSRAPLQTAPLQGPQNHRVQSRRGVHGGWGRPRAPSRPPQPVAAGSTTDETHRCSSEPTSVGGASWGACRGRGSPKGTVTHRGPTPGWRSSKAAVRVRKKLKLSKKQDVEEGNQRPSPHRRGWRRCCNTQGVETRRERGGCRTEAEPGKPVGSSYGWVLGFPGLLPGQQESGEGGG